jgi:DNA-binding NarL/FixJ family response regulator
MRDEPTRERSTASLRVLVVDDSELFRTGLQALLLHEAFEVANAANGESALRQVLTFRPDVVVMDMGMPDMSGCEATRRILEVAPNTAVMMLTGSDGGDVLAAVRAGASGYVLKGAEVADIVKAIRATAAGHSPFAPQVTGALLATVRELVVLKLLARGCNNDEIAHRLYISRSTVKHQVSGLLLKLHVANRIQAACVAVRAGLLDDSASVS